MKHIYLLLDVLNEGVYTFIILNLVKELQSFYFLAIPNMFVTFKHIKVLFVKYIIKALPINSHSFINKANNFAYFFLNNVEVNK